MRDSALYGIAGALGKVLALVTVPILSRSLGPADYGLADLATAFSSLAVLIVTFSGDIAAARLAALSKDGNERRKVHASWVAATIAVSLASVLLLLPMAHAIAGGLWNEPRATGLAVLAIVLIPVTAVQTTLVNILRIESRPVASAAMATVDLVAQLSLSVAFVLVGWGPSGLLAGLVLGGGIGLLAAAMTAAPHLTARPAMRMARRLVWQGLPFVPGVVLFIVADYVVRYLTLEQLGQTEVGQLALANRVAGAMLLISAAFSLAWGPFGMAQAMSEKTRRLFGTVTMVFGGLGAAAALTIAAVAPEVAVVLSGQAYAPAAEAMPGLLGAAVMSGLFFILSIGAGVQQRTAGVPVSAAAGAVAQVALTAALLPLMGLAGVGLGSLSGRAISLAILASTTRNAVAIRGQAMAIGAGALLLAAVLGVANADPGSSLPYRLTVVVLVAAASTALLWIALPKALAQARR